MATKRVRWECPNGHPAILASSRPPVDSIERYCLPCSAQTGRLVQRVAPALERKRASAAASSAAKAKARRAAAARARQRAKEAEEASYIVDDIDLRAEMKRLLRLPAFGGRQGRLAKRPPTLTISRRHTKFVGRLGYAEPWSNRITIAVYSGQTRIEALHTLVHELTHIAVGSTRTATGRNSWHGSEFRITLAKAWRQSYGPDGRYSSVLHKAA